MNKTFRLTIEMVGNFETPEQGEAFAKDLLEAYEPVHGVKLVTSELVSEIPWVDDYEAE